MPGGFPSQAPSSETLTLRAPEAARVGRWAPILLPSGTWQQCATALGSAALQITDNHLDHTEYAQQRKKKAFLKNIQPSLPPLLFLNCLPKDPIRQSLTRPKPALSKAAALLSTPLASQGSRTLSPRGSCAQGSLQAPRHPQGFPC